MISLLDCLHMPNKSKEQYTTRSDLADLRKDLTRELVGKTRDFKDETIAQVKVMGELYLVE